MSTLYDNGLRHNSGVLCPKCKQVTDYREWLDSPGGYLEQRVCENCGNTYKYPEDAGESSLYERFAYEASCNDHTLTVLTQADRQPEYYTTVTVICPIHNTEVTFNLPVN